MAWARTVLAFCVTSAVLLRWVRMYGVSVLALSGGLATVAVVCYLTVRWRYRRQGEGVADGALEPATETVVLLTLALITLGGCALVFLIRGAGA